jgi:tryptophan synthase beta chain
MFAYQRFNDGQMSDYIPTDEEIAASLAKVPQI